MGEIAVQAKVSATFSAGQDDMADLWGTATGTWNPPARVSATDLSRIRSAETFLARAKQPADDGLRREWLASLAALTAGNMPAADAKIRITAYLPGLDQPAGCFTKASLYAIGAKFTWFPSFAEVKAELDRCRWWIEARALRLKQLREKAAAAGKPEPNYVSAEKLAELRESLTGKRGNPAPNLSPEEHERRRRQTLEQMAAAGMIPNDEAAA